VNPTTQAVADVVMECTRGEGVDVVVDNVGTRASVREALGLLRPGGKLLVVAYLDDTFEVPAIPLFKPEREIIGCRGASRQDLVDVVRLTAAGKLAPVIGARYAFGEAEAAAARLERGDFAGRIVLTQG
jgi:propanol-preferring alcohol dehydrogenase